MTPAHFKAWRGRRTQAQAAALLGRSVRQIRDYEAGRAPIDRTVALACAAVEMGLEGYDQHGPTFNKARVAELEQSAIV